MSDLRSALTAADVVVKSLSIREERVPVRPDALQPTEAAARHEAALNGEAWWWPEGGRPVRFLRQHLDPLVVRRTEGQRSDRPFGVIIKRHTFVTYSIGGMVMPPATVRDRVLTAEEVAAVLAQHLNRARGLG